MVGYDFNVNSTQQLSTALFEHMGIAPPRGTRRTASGHFSTAVGVLTELAAEHEVVRDLLQYRELAKLKSTYVDALPMAVNEDTGRVAYIFPSDRYCYWKASLFRPESTEHPNPYRGRAAGA